MGIRTMVKLYCGCWGHYATIYLDEIKNIEQNGAYWYIEMKDGDTWEDAQNFVITNDPWEKVGYFVKMPDEK
jgi:hypothetical protein